MTSFPSRGATFTVMSVTVEALRENLLAAGGKARGCLSADHDIVPFMNRTVTY